MPDDKRFARRSLPKQHTGQEHPRREAKSLACGLGVLLRTWRQVNVPAVRISARPSPGCSQSRQGKLGRTATAAGVVKWQTHRT